jgi:hypothetical protein
MKLKIMIPFMVITMVLSLQLRAATTYYFSQSAGSDSNNGTDSTTAKKSISAALALMGSGNTILFKRGDQWYLPLFSLDLTGKSNFTINAYGSPSLAKPVLAGMSILTNTSWVYDGLFKWRYAITYDSIFRVIVNGATKMNLKYEINKTNSKDSLKTTSEYYFDTAAKNLYLYTGSSTVGPQNVEIVPGSITYPNGLSTVLMSGTSTVTIHNIDFRGGSKWNIMAVYAPSNNIIIDNCTIQRASSFASGLLVGDTLKSSTNYVSHITVTNNVVDKSFSTLENSTWKTLSGDGIFFLNAVDTGTISGNTIFNWGHLGISLTSYYAVSPNIHGVHHVTVEQNDVSAGVSAYTHALDVSGLPGLTTYNVIKRNNFHDYTTTCHLQGSNNLFFSNIFNGVIATTKAGQSIQPFGGDVVPWRRPEGIMEAKDNWILNNTFANTGGYSLWIGWNDSAMKYNTNVTNNKIANNIMYNFKDFPMALDTLALDIDTTADGTNYYRNNNFYAGDSTGWVVRYKKYPFYSASGFNTALGCNGDCTNNTQSNPQFTGYFVLGNSIPTALKTGGIDYSSLICPAYIPLSEFVDYLGNQWRTGSPGPSRGAVQK